MYMVHNLTTWNNENIYFKRNKIQIFYTESLEYKLM
jgi:hypothetical protein